MLKKKNYGIYAGGQDHYEVWVTWEGRREAKISGHETHDAAVEACSRYVAADMRQEREP